MYICLCLGIKEEDLESHVKDYDEEQLQSYLKDFEGLGGCGACKDTLIKTLQQTKQ